MNEELFTLEIMGADTREALAGALERIAHQLRTATAEELDGAEWEDPILCTKINLA